MSRTKKKIAIICGLAVVILPLVVLFKIHFMPLSQEDYDRARNAPRQSATTNTIYKSPDGFSILIPAGYQYAPINSEHFTIFASKPPCNLEGTKHRWRFGNLNKMFAAGIDTLRKKHKNILFGTPVDIDLGSVTGIRTDYSMSFPDRVVRGSCIWFKIGSTLYQFVFTCPDQIDEGIRVESERMLGSLNVERTGSTNRSTLQNAGAFWTWP